MDWLYTTQDLFTALVTLFSELLWGISSLIGTALLAVQFGGVGGLNAEEVLVMLSFHLFARGWEVILFAGNNVSCISRRIGRSQVDHMFLQPIPLWMQLLTEGFMPVSGCQQLICGVIALCVFVPKAGITVDAGWFLLLALLVICRITLYLSIAFMAGSAAFYNPVAYEEFSDVALSLMDVVCDYPLSGMPPWFVGMLCTVLPLGALTYLPGLLLLGRLDAVWAAWPVLLALVLAGISQNLFRKGLKHYVKAGCARYKSLGHRS